MPTLRLAVPLSFVTAVFLSACAPPPPAHTPVFAEPRFNKYGQRLADCRPPDQPISSAYPANLPICETGGGCPGDSYRITGAQGVVCVPIPREEGGGNGQSGQTTGG